MNIQILIIDSEKTAIEKLSEGLESPGVQLTISASSVDGLGILVQRRFDVVVINYSPSDEAAGTICTVVKKRDEDTALIVTSSIQSRELEKKIRSFSPAMYLPKPYAISDMKAVISRIIQWKKSLS